MPRRFITKTDIDVIADRGGQRLEIDDRTTVTDLAREHAHQRGVAIVRVAAGGSAPAEGSAGASPPVGGGGDPALRSAVRAAVIGALGTKPDGLDAALDRVLGTGR